MMKRLIRGTALVATGGALATGGYIYYSIVKTNQQFERHGPLITSHLNNEIPSREKQLKRIQENEKFDVIVVGGGATGCGVALDASTRGLSVCLLEKDDFASGTSSRSTKMAHGGVRYLERAVNNMDLSELHFVYDSLRERQHFFNVAPHLASPLALITPCYSYFDSVYMYIGLKMYDILSKTAPVPDQPDQKYKSDVISRYSAGWVPSSQVAKFCPSIKRSGLVGGIRYYDGVFNDARMSLTLALTSAAMGGCVVNHMKVKSLLKDDEGRNIGVVAVDTITQKEYNIHGRSIVNATGYLADNILHMDNKNNSGRIIVPSTGTHLTVDKSVIPEGAGILFPKTKDGRVLFVVPWQGRTIIGTTDNAIEDLSQIAEHPPRPTVDDVDYILDHVNHAFDTPIRRDQVLSSWTGVRPLVDPTALQKNLEQNAAESGQKSTAVLSRDHFINVSDSNLVTICGGKWTTFRRMAEETVDAAIEAGHLNKKQSSAFSTLLIGAPYNFDLTSLEQETGDRQLAEHLFHYYGSKASNVIETGKKALAVNWNRKLSEKFPHVEAEVLHQVRSEYAQSAVDVVAYRTNMMILDTAEAKRIVPRVVEIMGDELKWDRKRREKETESCYAYINNCTR